MQRYVGVNKSAYLGALGYSGKAKRSQGYWDKKIILRRLKTERNPLSGNHTSFCVRSHMSRYWGKCFKYFWNKENQSFIRCVEFEKESQALIVAWTGGL